MKLAGQPFGVARGTSFDGAHGQRGYAMVALLVGMSVMAVLMSALLPVWSHMATREKEDELIFRGKQYVRAIGLWQRKYANTAPPTIDVLVEQRFLRKKYKDPITNDDFQPLYANQRQQGISAPTGAQRPGQQASTTLSTPAQQTQTQQPGAGTAGGGAVAPGGIIGVTSKSSDASIKLYNGRDRYNEWAFVYTQTAQQPTQLGGPGGLPGGQQRPGGFGMPGATVGNTGRGGPQGPGGQGPGGRGQFQQPPPGFGQPNRPPIGSPGFGPGTQPGATTPGAATPGGTPTPFTPGVRRPGQ